MKSAPLLLEEIHFIQRDSITTDSTDAEIIALMTSETRAHHTPGTATLSSEKKNSTSGDYYQHEIIYSTPGWVSDEYNLKISKAGAVVIRAKGGRYIVFHKNDLFQNVKLRPSINFSTEKSQVKFSINSINPV